MNIKYLRPRGSYGKENTLDLLFCTHILFCWIKAGHFKSDDLDIERDEHFRFKALWNKILMRRQK